MTANWDGWFNNVWQAAVILVIAAIGVLVVVGVVVLVRYLVTKKR